MFYLWLRDWFYYFSKSTNPKYIKSDWVCCIVYVRRYASKSSSFSWACRREIQSWWKFARAANQRLGMTHNFTLSAQSVATQSREKNSRARIGHRRLHVRKRRRASKPIPTAQNWEKKIGKNRIGHYVELCCRISATKYRKSRQTGQTGNVRHYFPNYSKNNL